MLKTLSLTPEDGGDENAESHESESRMLRALNALSSNAPEQTGRGERGGDQRGQRGDQSGVFRQNRGPARDTPRGDGGSAFAARARHRFVKDGEVPVVHMAVPRPRDVAAPVAAKSDPEMQRLQQMLEDQRHKLDQADRARLEAQAQLRHLQTKLAHIEMSLTDATALAESRQAEIAALREQLREQDAAATLRPIKAASPPAPVAHIQANFDGMADPAPVKRPVGRPRTRPIEPVRLIEPTEPEPVQWWLAPTLNKRGRRPTKTG